MDDQGGVRAVIDIAALRHNPRRVGARAPQSKTMAMLWGPQLAVDLVAQHVGTIVYDLLCGITARVSRIEISAPDHDGGQE